MSEHDQCNDPSDALEMEQNDLIEMLEDIETEAFGLCATLLEFRAHPPVIGFSSRPFEVGSIGPQKAKLEEQAVQKLSAAQSSEIERLFSMLMGGYRNAVNGNISSGRHAV